MLVYIFRFLLTIALISIMIFALAPGNWTPAWVVNHDKFSHMVVFFILAFMLKFSFPKMPVFMQLSLLIAFAFTIELLQYLFFNRGFSVIDLIYDLIGIGLFVVLKGSVPFLVEFIPYKKGTASFKANE